MMQGIVNSAREAIIGIQIHGPSQSRYLYAQVDTGFNGFLSLHLSMIHELQLPAIGARQAKLADGTRAVLETFAATVTWEGIGQSVSVVESDGGCMLGMAMLKNSRLTIDVVEGGPVVVEPLTN